LRPLGTAAPRNDGGVYHARAPVRREERGGCALADALRRAVAERESSSRASRQR
jgi:hypothetical protein